MISPSLSVLFSEGVLSLYPILIKTVPTNLFTQWFARFLTFPVLAFLVEPSTIELSSTTFFAGLLNLIHVGVSYLSFYWLPAGTALSLFYLYPLFNIIAGSIFFGESISALSVLLLIIAFIGVYLISSSPSPITKETAAKETETVETTKETAKDTYSWGIIMALLAALTETLIFVFVRWNKMARISPFYTIKQLYPFGLLLLLMYLGTHPEKLDTNPTHLLQLFGFNALIGFIGYCVRFYAIPKLPTVVFSLLSFVGIMFGYIWGRLFTADRPSPTSWMGSALIIISVFFVRSVGTKE